MFRGLRGGRDEYKTNGFLDEGSFLYSYLNLVPLPS